MTEEFARSRTWQLLILLSDGEFHSGEDLAEKLGVSRASVFNSLAEAEKFGVELHRIRGRGYRLSRPWKHLDREAVVRGLGMRANLFNIEIIPKAISTNATLMKQALQGAPSGRVFAAELQTSGRGRLGRTWHTGLGTALTFSILWRFACGLNDLQGLSLAIGVALVRALTKFGALGVKLKWPNDIQTPQGKLGGVLIEAQGDMLGPSAAVIGIGINYTLPVELVRMIGQPACALDELCDVLHDRNRLFADILTELADVLEEFALSGFSTLRNEWESNHLYHGREVNLQMPDGRNVSGIAHGVTEKGELCLESPQGMQSYNSGEIGFCLQ